MADDGTETEQVRAAIMAQRLALQIILLTLTRESVLTRAQIAAMKAETLSMVAQVGRTPGRTASSIRMEEEIEKIFWLAPEEGLDL